jgi:hypothetical protein
MSTYADTPVSKLKTGGMNDKHIPISDWANYHSVYPFLLPMHGRRTNAFDVIKEIKAKIESQPTTSETFRVKKSYISGDGHYFPKFLPLFGVTRFNKTSKGRRYRNPNYIHYDTRVRQDPIDNSQDRLDFFHKHKINPHLSSRFYAKHWDMKPRSASKFLYRRGIRISDERHYARKRLGKTLYTRMQWDDVQAVEVIDPLPFPNRTIRDWINFFAKDAEWLPPKNPEDYRWYTGNK